MNRVATSSRWTLDPLHGLFAARALRDFGDSFVAILLPAYLLALGFSPLAVGVLATASLLRSACLTTSSHRKNSDVMATRVGCVLCTQVPAHEHQGRP